MTTAELRNKARAAEANLDWATAAKLYREAVAAYPQQDRIRKDCLAALDIQRLTQRAEVCENLAAA